MQFLITRHFSNKPPFLLSPPYPPQKGLENKSPGGLYKAIL